MPQCHSWFWRLLGSPALASPERYVLLQALVCCCCSHLPHRPTNPRAGRAGLLQHPSQANGTPGSRALLASRQVQIGLGASGYAWRGRDKSGEFEVVCQRQRAYYSLTATGKLQNVSKALSRPLRASSYKRQPPHPKHLQQDSGPRQQLTTMSSATGEANQRAASGAVE